MDASSTQFDWKSDTWDVIKSMFSRGGSVHVSHQIESFNHFMSSLIPRTIQKEFPLEVLYYWVDERGASDGDPQRKCVITVTNITIGKPLYDNIDSSTHILPDAARRQNLTYASSVSVSLNVRYITENASGPVEQVIKVSNVPIASIPVMVQSKYCYLNTVHPSALPSYNESHNDRGGYFIVKGNEKVIITKVNQPANTVWCFKRNNDTKHIAECSIKSTPNQSYYPLSIVNVFITKPPALKQLDRDNSLTQKLRVDIPRVKGLIPLFVMFRALGIETDRDIVELVLGDYMDDTEIVELLANSSIDEKCCAAASTLDINCQIDALDYIVKVQPSLRNRGKTATVIGEGEDGTEEKTVVHDPKAGHDAVLEILTKDLFPHIGPFSDDLYAKAVMLAGMTRKLLLCALGRTEYDDRDYMANKYAEQPGILMNRLFRDNFLALIKNVKSAIGKAMERKDTVDENFIRKLFHVPMITSKFRYALATGNWVTPSSSSLTEAQKGTAQILSRVTHPSTISNMRRQEAPLPQGGKKYIPPRRMKLSSLGRLCPNETPEGQQVGVVTNYAQGCRITLDTSDYKLRRVLFGSTFGVMPISEYSRVRDVTVIFVNGDPIGLIPNADANAFHTKLRILKRHWKISPFTGLTWFIGRGEYHIRTSGGRYTRPVYIVESIDGNRKLLIEHQWNRIKPGLADGSMSWEKLCGSGMCEDPRMTLTNGAVVEYIDVDEESTALIAMNQKELLEWNDPNSFTKKLYTHCEIHASLWNGYMANLIPFIEFNPSPRNCYQCSMGKQAIGFYTSNWMTRMDSSGHVLVSAQRPLLTTKYMEFSGLRHLHHGINAIVGIGVYYGFNQEDSVILNRCAVERGFAASIFFRTYTAREQKNRSGTSSKKKFGQVSDQRELCSKKYRRSDRAKPNVINPKTGAPAIGSYMEGGDIVIDMFMELPKDMASEYKYKHVPEMLNQTEQGYVDRVIPEADAPRNELFDSDGFKFMKARVCEYREPEIGDKFATRQAQKGTVGMEFAQEDLPTTSDGLTPDIMMNPHAMPSRMTLALLLEGVVTLASLLQEHDADGTAFCQTDHIDTGLTEEIVRNITVTQRKYLREMSNVVEPDAEPDGPGFRMSFLQGANYYDEYGRRVVYNGRSGEQMDIPYTMTPIFYQRLKHMVRDKIHARNTGRVQLLTRQPTEGRIREGGLRFGEMERDCLIAYGASKLLNERLNRESDLTSVYVSEQDQCLIQANPDENIYKFEGMDITDRNIHELQIPYAMKILMDEMAASGVMMKLIT